jgi:hypothetical protein
LTEIPARDLAPGDVLAGPRERQVTSVRRDGGKVLLGIDGVPDVISLPASSSIVKKG